MKRKILVGLLLIFLVIGTCAAFDVDSLKPIDDCKNFKDGVSVYKTYDSREFYVEKLNTPEVYFENTDDLYHKTKDWHIFLCNI